MAYRRLIGAFAMLGFLGVAACAPVQFVARYDGQTDLAAQTMQRDIATFFVKMTTSAVTADTSFAANQSFYQQETVNIGAMQLRAAQIPKNDLTMQQLELVKENLAYLALLHKHCVSGALTDAQQAAVRQNGIDASLDCHVSFGASADKAGQGNMTLEPFIIPILSSQFDTSLGAIMKLEFAKKRGSN